MRALLRAIDFTSEWSGKIFSYLWVATVLVISYETVLRYVFDAPTRWGHETMIFLCGILYVMGGAYTLYHRKHVSVDLLYNRFSPRGRAILDVLTFPLFCLFIGVLLWAGADRTWEAIIIRETTGSPWNPPVYPILLMIPLGAFLMLLQGLAKFIGDLVIAVGRSQPR